MPRSQSFVNARPGAFRLEDTDCKFPDDDGFARPDGQVEFSCECFSLPSSASGLSRFGFGPVCLLICNPLHVVLIPVAFISPVTQIMDGSSDIQPRVLPQLSNLPVRSRPLDTPSSSNSIGGFEPSHYPAIFNHRWTSLRKDGQTIRRWRCSNMVSYANGNRVSTLWIYRKLVVRLIGVSRSVVSSPSVLCQSNSASLEESARS